jgi:hypothetical protein
MFYRFKFLLLLLTITFIVQGCLIFNTISYEINLETENSGTVSVFIHDIKSNAMSSKELNEDKHYLFEFALKSDEFVNQMEEEGKYIDSRKFEIVDNKLNGKVLYSFDEISNVEGIVYDEPFYFLTLALEDSVISTNGEIIISEGHKRIIWDNSIETLKFSMFREETSDKNYVGMAQYYKNDE